MRPGSRRSAASSSSPTRRDAWRRSPGRRRDPRQVDHDRLARPRARPGRGSTRRRSSGRCCRRSSPAAGDSVVRLGEGRPTVVEADEYAGNFDPYRPVDRGAAQRRLGPPGRVRDRAAVVDGVRGLDPPLSGSVAGDGGAEPPTLVANAGDPGVQELLAAAWPTGPAGSLAFDGRRRRRECGRAPAGRARLRRIGRPRVRAGSLVARYDGRPPTGRRGSSSTASAGHDGRGRDLRLVGRHNADDALGAAGAALAYGARRRGRPRRARHRSGGSAAASSSRATSAGSSSSTTTAIIRRRSRRRSTRSTLRYPGRRRWAVYEPLTFHRTAALLEPFADVLATADRVAIADIYAVRDPDQTIVSAADLARRGRAPRHAGDRARLGRGDRRRRPAAPRAGRRRPGHGRRPIDGDRRTLLAAAPRRSRIRLSGAAALRPPADSGPRRWRDLTPIGSAARIGVGRASVGAESQVVRSRATLRGLIRANTTG